MTALEEGPPSPRNWTAIWESAAAAAASHWTDAPVYTGPAWEIPNPKASSPARVWKIAVLQRRVGRGAEHWGHLWLVLSEPPVDVELQPLGGISGNRESLSVEILPGSPATPFQVRLRPLSEETSARLRAFALEFQRYAARLASGDSDRGTTPLGTDR